MHTQLFIQQVGYFSPDWNPFWRRFLSYILKNEWNSNEVKPFFFFLETLEAPRGSKGKSGTPLCASHPNVMICAYENLYVYERGDVGRAERDAETARTVNILLELALMHGERHGFRDSCARPASSPPPSPPAFYYYWDNITQAALIIHHHLSAKSHAEETRHPAAWTEIRVTAVRWIVSFVLPILNKLWALIIKWLHADGAFKRNVIFHARAFARGTTTPVHLASIIDRVPPIYEVQNTLKEMPLFSCSDE